MPKLFEDDRNYVLGDPELDLIGDRAKLGQWRHQNVGPAYYKLGRKVIYRGSDLNDWAGENRVDPSMPEVTQTKGVVTQEAPEKAPKKALDLTKRDRSAFAKSIGGVK